MHPTYVSDLISLTRETMRERLLAIRSAVDEVKDTQFNLKQHELEWFMQSVETNHKLLNHSLLQLEKRMEQLDNPK
jgi:hypothetical protein